MQNLVLITSVIRNPKKSFYLSEEQRLEQTIKSVTTAKERIPNPYLIVLEGGPRVENDEKLLKEAGANEVIYFDVSSYLKDNGEIQMLKSFFKLERLNEFKEKYSTLSKMSGRW